MTDSGLLRLTSWVCERLVQRHGLVRIIKHRIQIAHDHAVDARTLVVGIQRPQPIGNLGISLGRSFVVADVLGPGRGIIAFDPDIRPLQVT